MNAAKGSSNSYAIKVSLLRPLFLDGLLTVTRRKRMSSSASPSPTGEEGRRYLLCIPHPESGSASSGCFVWVFSFVLLSRRNSRTHVLLHVHPCSLWFTRNARETRHLCKKKQACSSDQDIQTMKCGFAKHALLSYGLLRTLAARAQAPTCTCEEYVWLHW
jgi:hypothetical protein